MGECAVVITPVVDVTGFVAGFVLCAIIFLTLLSASAPRESEDDV